MRGRLWPRSGILVLILCAGAACDHELAPGESIDADPTIWSIRLGGTGSECVASLTADRDGNLLLAGDFETNAIFGTYTDLGTGPLEARTDSNPDVFLVSLTPDGLTRWVAILGGEGMDETRDVMVDPSGALVIVGSAELRAGGGVNTGDFGVGEVSFENDSFFVTKLLPDSTALWSTLIPSERGTPDDIESVMDAQGNIFVVSKSRPYPDIEPWPQGDHVRSVLTKIDPTGHVLWRRIPLPSEQDVFVWDIESAPDGGLYVGAIRHPATIAPTGIIAKLEADGSTAFMRDTTDVPYAMARLPDGDLAVLFFNRKLMRISPEGDTRWTQPMTEPFDVSGGPRVVKCGRYYDVMATPSGDIVASDLGAVVTFSGAGEPLRDFVPDGDTSRPGLAQVNAMHALDDGRTVFAGIFTDVVGLGGDSHRSMGGTDLFVAIPAE